MNPNLSPKTEHASHIDPSIQVSSAYEYSMHHDPTLLIPAVQTMLFIPQWPRLDDVQNILCRKFNHGTTIV